MIHIIYDNTVYLNIDNAKAITVKGNFLQIKHSDKTFELDLTTHPTVQKILKESKSEERNDIIKVLGYKVLEMLVECIAKKDQDRSPIFNLEVLLSTLHKQEEGEQKEAPEMIPVTVNENGDVTKVLTEEQKEN